MKRKRTAPNMMALIFTSRLVSTLIAMREGIITYKIHLHPMFKAIYPPAMGPKCGCSYSVHPRLQKGSVWATYSVREG